MTAGISNGWIRYDDKCDAWAVQLPTGKLVALTTAPLADDGAMLSALAREQGAKAVRLAIIPDLKEGGFCLTLDRSLVVSYARQYWNKSVSISLRARKKDV